MFEFSKEQNKAWDRINTLIDEGKGDTPEYRKAWVEWEVIVKGRL